MWMHIATNLDTHESNYENNKKYPPVGCNVIEHYLDQLIRRIEAEKEVGDHLLVDVPDRNLVFSNQRGQREQQQAVMVPSVPIGQLSGWPIFMQIYMRQEIIQNNSTMWISIRGNLIEHIATNCAEGNCTHLRGKEHDWRIHREFARKEHASMLVTKSMHHWMYRRWETPPLFRTRHTLTDHLFNCQWTPQRCYPCRPNYKRPSPINQHKSQI